MKRDILAGRYLKALTNTLDSDSLVPVLGQLTEIITVIKSNETVKLFFESPAVPQSDKVKALNTFIDKSGLGKELGNFLRLLAKNNKFELLSDMDLHIDKAIDTQLNQSSAIVFSSSPLTDKQEQDLVTYLKDSTDKTIKAKFKQSDEFIGGFKAILDNTIYDGTLENSINLLLRSTN